MIHPNDNRNANEVFNFSQSTAGLDHLCNNVDLLRYQAESDPADLACRLDELGAYCLAIGRIDDAEAAFREAVTLLEQTCGANHPDTCNVQIHLAELSINTGCPAIGLAVAQTAHANTLDILEYGFAGRPIEEPHRSIVTQILAQAAGTIAIALRGLGWFDEAFPFAQESLDLTKCLFGDDDLQTAIARNNLGVLHKYRGEFSAARRQYVEARKSIETKLPESESSLAAVLYNLGGLEHALENYSAAESFVRRALEIRQSQLGPEHPEVGVVRLTLGAILDGQKRFLDARQQYEVAIQIFTEAYGNDHPDIAHALNNLAEIHKQAGNLHEAEDLHRQALEMRERVLGRYHPDVGSSLNNLAMLWLGQGREDEAVDALHRAVEILSGLLEKDHPKFVTVSGNLAEAIAVQNGENFSGIQKNAETRARSARIK